MNTEIKGDVDRLTERFTARRIEWQGKERESRQPEAAAFCRGVLIGLGLAAAIVGVGETDRSSGVP